MKNLKLLKVAVVLLCLVASSAVNGSNLNAKPKNTRSDLKTKIIRVKDKNKQFTYYIFLTFGTNKYEFVGHGGGSSGTISSIYKACINGVLYNTGTCSGNYIISGGEMDIEYLYFTVTGFPEQGPYGGGAAYSSSPIVFSCGN